MLIRPAAALAGLTVVASLALAGCGSDSDDTATDSTGVACDYPSAGAAAKDVEPPPATATATGTVPVTISTNVGDLHADLDADSTPCTVNSFVSLADQGYFDDTTCHRLTTAAAGIFVLQCGDPTGSGTGGPGYSFPDELSGSEKYTAGTLAMANGGVDTNGSQFFIVYGDTLHLDPDYTVFGKVDDASVKIVKQVAAQGTVDGSGSAAPKQPVDITRVTVGQG